MSDKKYEAPKRSIFLFIKFRLNLMVIKDSQLKP